MSQWDTYSFWEFFLTEFRFESDANKTFPGTRYTAWAWETEILPQGQQALFHNFCNEILMLLNNMYSTGTLYSQLNLKCISLFAIFCTHSDSLFTYPCHKHTSKTWLQTGTKYSGGALNLFPSLNVVDTQLHVTLTIILRTGLGGSRIFRYEGHFPTEKKTHCSWARGWNHLCSLIYIN